MSLQLLIHNSSTSDSDYITWSRSECTLSDTNDGTANNVTDILLRNQNTGSGGQVVFMINPTNPESNELQLSMPANGSPLTFHIAGRFGFPSMNDKDAAIEVVDRQTGDVILTKNLMVRIRKNANNLSDGERDRLLQAFGRLNSSGAFADYRNMHMNITSFEAHGNAGFLPWHRAYLLDLERELQKIDPSVTLPYYKFDEPAPNIFNVRFLGVPDATGMLTFSDGNPLRSWSTDGTIGISRTPNFAPTGRPNRVISEAATLNLSNRYRGFVDIEDSPHGVAHKSFSGYLSELHTAAKDPLFFLLHINVDRLWAKWQLRFNRFNTPNSNTYSFSGSAGSPGSTTIGHNLLDTMWPWNQDNNRTKDGMPLPSPAPGGSFPTLQFPAAPSATPTVRDMIDYLGVVDSRNKLGFAYDDVSLN